ncbi:hypothetical protein IT411_01465 [Candidatus Peregrinibacteria bacterium]|nr:hypothetical protein [Candidatus Peregrinibacteria bacterium]
MKLLDRKAAADLLKVSVRTIDRYLKKGVIGKEEINGRILVKMKDLKPLLEQRNLLYSALSSDHEDNPTIPDEQPHQAEYQSSSVYAASTSGEDLQIYKKLYEELQEELKIKQERLEGANYRVGQLEGILKESVPLIEYRKALALEEQKRDELEDLLSNFERETELLNQTLDSKKIELEQNQTRLNAERFNKKVFIIILIVLFLLQPLWLLFPPA